MAGKKKGRKIEDIAEEFMPGWKAVQKFSPDEAQQVSADAAVPELAELKRKYFGEQADGASDAAATGAADDDDDSTGLVVMENQTPHDAHTRRKVLFVEKGRIKGAQG